MTTEHEEQGQKEETIFLAYTGRRMTVSGKMVHAYRPATPVDGFRDDTSPDLYQCDGSTTSDVVTFKSKLLDVRIGSVISATHKGNSFYTGKDTKFVGRVDLTTTTQWQAEETADVAAQAMSRKGSSPEQIPGLFEALRGARLAYQRTDTAGKLAIEIMVLSMLRRSS